MQHISLTIASRPEDVSLVAAAVRGLCESAGLHPTAVLQIELALVEALNNVILHGYQSRPEHQIRTDWQLVDDCVRIEILDQGQTLASLPDGDMPEAMSESGRGWPIIRACMDRVDYHSSQGVNHLTLIKRAGHHSASGPHESEQPCC
jgi:anti-sigma regulatory factor (Ser/Thr protein kinase)